MSGLAIKSYNNPVITVPQTVEAVVSQLCACSAKCFYQEPVFADSLASGDYWKQDKSDFLLSKVTASDTIVFEIWKGSSLQATITDQTYGDFYNFGDFSSKPLYTGFVANWTSIFNAFSGGLYKIKIQVTILGNSYTVESRDFRLNAYSDNLAHNTFRLESYQSGNILSDPLDYTDLLTDGWYSSMRIAGRFGKKTPTHVEDNYHDSNYKLEQNRPSTTYEYTLDTMFIPETLGDQISSRDSLANAIFITDYSLNNDLELRRVPVAFASFDDTEHPDNGKLRYIIKMKPRTENNIKRNF